MRAGWHEFRLRLKALFMRRRMDREMAEELAFHQAMLREKAMRNGSTEEEAATAARRAFGNPSRWHERLRELWQFQPLENLARDFSFSFRLLGKSPGFTFVAIATLALGFGANMGIFSLINALLLRPLPVPHSEQLVAVGFDEHGPFGPNYGVSAPIVREMEKQKDLFSGIFAYNTNSETQIRGASGNERATAQFVTGQFFSTLETPPLLGRVLSPADDLKGAGLSVVISEAFWKSWFGGTQQVIGRKLVVDSGVFTVVGVMPGSFFGADPTVRPAFFVPLASEEILHAPKSWVAMGNHAWWLTIMGRLRPDVTLGSANAALSTRTLPLLRAAQWEPDRLKDDEEHHANFSAIPGSRGFTYLRRVFRRPLVAIFAMCGGILLLACLNLASLLLARSAARTQEIATRLALGASRTALVRQLLIESFLVAMGGVGLGLAVAPMIGRSLSAILLGNNSRMTLIDTSLDVRVWFFAVSTAVVASVIIGLVPALRATSRGLYRGLRQGRTMEPGERRRWTPRLLLSLEVSLAVILLVCAGLLTTSLVRLYRTGAGFDAQGLVGLTFDMDRKKMAPREVIPLYQQIEEELRRQPGVRQVSFVNVMPLIGMQWTNRLSSQHAKDQTVYMSRIAPDYFDTMRIPLLRGRDFRWTDSATDTEKVILNKKAATMLFGDQDPIGRTVLSGPAREGQQPRPIQVIGVVADTKYSGLRENFNPIGYSALTQADDETATYFAVVRTSGATGPLASAARGIAHRLAPDIPAPTMMTMQSVLNDSIGTERMMAMLSVYFAGCALLVTAIGLYGTLSYETARRTSEIGIRMALGAQRGQVVRMVYKENTWIAFSGAAAGLIIAILASRALASFLYETSGRDPWVLIVSVAALVAVASAASLLPAIRAARVDPMAAIRTE
ncbi:ABC transporter permease [Silvibacterium acidisoli]|uniref:ABC transporter permease n=1 Tax=Acidobacteriaceae bacterium ZG23-2 TaxID=2883246 RepID=UPI00406C0703